MTARADDGIGDSLAIGNETLVCPLKVKIWESDWFYIAFLWLLKLSSDAVFWKNQSAEYVYDNIDYLDYAKQFFYAKTPAAFYEIFLSAFGHIRSPFQSWLIFIGKSAFPGLSFEVIAYLIQTACLLFLTVAALQLSKRLAEFFGGEWSPACSLALAAAVILAPLSIGLGRGTLVEPMLTASIMGVYWVGGKILRSASASQVCVLNLLVAVGDLTKFSFPTYVALPLAGILVYGFVLRKYSAIFFSVFFQVLVQVGFCYNLVNIKSMLETAKSVVLSWQFHHQDSIFREIAVNGFGIPYLCFVLFLGTLAARHAIQNGSPKLSPTRWLNCLLALRPQHLSFEIIGLSLAGVNLAMMLTVHLRATVQMIRYFFPFVVVGIILTLAVFSALRLQKRVMTIAAVALAAGNLAVCLLFSVPTTSTSCTHPLLTKVFNVDCERADPLDGTLFAPRSDNYHIPDIIRLLSTRIAAGSDVVLVNPNEYFSHQQFYYGLRKLASEKGFYFNLPEIWARDVQSAGLWRNAKAVIFKDFTDYRYEIFVEQNPPPDYYPPENLAHLNSTVAARLSEMQAREIYRFKNSDGTVAVFLIDK